MGYIVMENDDGGGGGGGCDVEERMVGMGWGLIWAMVFIDGTLIIIL